MTSGMPDGEVEYQPVVLAVHDWQEELARSNGWRVVRANGRLLRVDDDLVLMPSHECSTVHPAVLGPDLQAWRWALQRIAEGLPRPLLLVGLGDPLHGLAHLAGAAFGWRYGLMIGDDYHTFGPEAYALTSGSAGMVYQSARAREAFTRYLVSPARDLRLTMTPATPEAEAPAEGTSPDAAPGDEVRVLIVSYFGRDCRTVSVKRLGYWFDELAGACELPTRVDTVTAFAHACPQGAQEGGSGSVHVVPDLFAACLLDERGELPPWGPAVIANERQDAAHHNTMGAYWIHAVEEYFRRRREEYDVVIISGNPFSIFQFAAFAKRRWHAKVVLDYRDPFANNPRGRSAATAIAYNRLAERGFNLMADAVTVVNAECVPRVESVPGVPILQIPNGFDDRIVPADEAAPPADGLVHFVHGGNFTSPGEMFVAALDPARHRLHQLGDVSVPPAADGVVVRHGRLDSAGVLQAVGRAHCGVSILSATGFETPTKVYDYLAMGIDVLLVHHGDAAECALHPVLQGLAGVHWVRHEQESIRHFLATYVPGPKRPRQQRAIFGRGRSTALLAALVADLVGGTHGTQPRRELIDAGA